MPNSILVVIPAQESHKKLLEAAAPDANFIYSTPKTVTPEQVRDADVIVGNDVTRPGAGFDVATNIVTFYDRQGETALPLLQKTEVADRILDRVARLLREKQDT